MAPENNQTSIGEMMAAAHLEIIRLGYKSSAISRHSKELREFQEYCDGNRIEYYYVGTGIQYFADRYGVDVTNAAIKLTQKQLDTRCTIRLLDDIYQFGYGRRFSHQDYNVPMEYSRFMEDYLAYCTQSNDSEGTIRVKRSKLRKFLCFLDGRRILLTNLTPSDLSDFMITLCQYHRATVHVFSSVLRDFVRYLHETEILEADLSPVVPRPKIYSEETIPETWTPEEVRQLLSVLNRNSAVGKRDYAMVLLAVTLGMRAGDICALKFENLDWHRKLITYTQQKTGKVSTLPLLPAIGEALIDYLKNGRLESMCSNIFIRHIHPYGPLQSSAALSGSIKRYMRQAGLTIKNRKAAHSLRHTLASVLLQDGTPLMTISNVFGHYTPQTTARYTKVNLSALRKCTLSYGGQGAL